MNTAGLWNHNDGSYLCRQMNLSKYPEYQANQDNLSSYQFEPLNRSDLLAKQRLNVRSTSNKTNLISFVIDYWPIDEESGEKSTFNSTTNDDGQFHGLKFAGLIENNNGSSIQKLIYLLTLYFIAEFVSILLNILTIIILARGFNCPLKAYVINLSVADVLMSFFSIVTTYGDYFPEFRRTSSSLFCRVVWGTVMLSVFVAATTITCIGINRYKAIMYPKSDYSIRLKVKETHIIILIWFMGLAVSASEYLTGNLQPFCCKEKVLFACYQIWYSYLWEPYIVSVLYLCCCAIPVSLLLYLYARIVLELWCRRRLSTRDINQRPLIESHQVEAAINTTFVVALFIISWFPITTYWMIKGINSQRYSAFSDYIMLTLLWISKLHSCFNPIIYLTRNKEFRNKIFGFIPGLKITTRSVGVSSQLNRLQETGDNNRGVKFINMDFPEPLRSWVCPSAIEESETSF